MSEAFSNVTVAEIIARPWQSKTLYSIKQTQSDDIIGIGEKTPTFTQGSVVSFTAKKNARGYYNMEANSLQIHEGVAPDPVATQKKAAPKPAVTKTVSRDDYWGNKEKKDIEKDERYQTQDIPRMSFSASQERAVALVCAALANDCIALGSAKGKRMDILLAQVDEVTKRFYVQSMNAPEYHKEILADAAKVAEAQEIETVADIGQPEVVKDEEDWEE